MVVDDSRLSSTKAFETKYYLKERTNEKRILYFCKVMREFHLYKYTKFTYNQRTNDERILYFCKVMREFYFYIFTKFTCTPHTVVPDIHIFSSR